MNPQPDNDETAFVNRRSRAVKTRAGQECEVIAVKRGLPWRDAGSGGAGILDFIVALVFELALEAVAVRRKQWKVAVIRPRWGGIATRVTQKEILPAGVDPDARMAELAAAIEAEGGQASG